MDYDGLNVIDLAYKKKAKINMGVVKPRRDVELFSDSDLAKSLAKEGMLFDDVSSG